MIVVDTNIWISHFRTPNPLLSYLLTEGEVLLHAYVLIEIALGSIGQRQDLLSALGDLPGILPGEPDEVLRFIEGHQLHSRGVGLVDCHLLLATKLVPHRRLWTNDKRLHGIARDLSLHFDHPDALFH
jgi:predicted nucleic acid-binding protein